MKIYIQISQDSRLTQLSYNRNVESEIELDVPESHEVLKNHYVFTYKEDRLIKDEVFQQQLIESKQNRKSELEILKETVDQLVLDNLMRGF